MWQAACVPGTTLVLDFPFPAFPDNMGHWVEVLAPAYSVLSRGAWCGRGSCRLAGLLLINLQREDLQVGPAGRAGQGSAICPRMQAAQPHPVQGAGDGAACAGPAVGHGDDQAGPAARAGGGGPAAAHHVRRGYAGPGQERLAGL